MNTHTEEDMIEATEKSATFMLGLAARARTAARLEEEIGKMKAEWTTFRKELATVVEEKLALQKELKDTQNALASRPVRDAQAIADLRRTLDAEGYDLPALATMAIQKIRDLDRALTDAKVNDKRLREELTRLAAKLDAQEEYIEKECRVPWEQLQAALPDPEPGDDRSLVQRVLDAIAASPAPSPDSVWCQVEGTITSSQMDRWHFVFTGSSYAPQAALLLCSRNPDGTFAPIARGFLPTYKIDP